MKNKVALVSMLGNVGTTLNTQGGGYGLIVTKMLNEEKHKFFPKEEFDDCQIDVNPDPYTWNDYSRLFICEGVNYVQGVFNIPGGPQPIHRAKMEAISGWTKPIHFINSEFSFSDFNKRIKIEDFINPTPHPRDLVVELFSDHGRDSLKGVVGDSHALSVWRPNYSLQFTPGRTLFGFLNRYESRPDIMENAFPNGLVLYFGNIDIRFHLCRQPDPIDATKKLVERYVKFVETIPNVTIVEPLPIEHESRKIPGTGLYKGQKYFGSREDRMKVRQVMIDWLRASGIPTISWPDEWIDDDGTKMLDILEQKQSVHLRPKYWKYINEIV